MFLSKNSNSTSKSTQAGGSTQVKKKAVNIPKNVQESIPYKSVYPNGIIEDRNGYFSKSYVIEDANFQTESEDKRTAMFLDYEKLLNSVTPGMRGQLTIFNRTIDPDTVRNNILMKPKDDGLNDLRDEWNNMFLDKMSRGRNNLKKDKIFTVSVKEEDIYTANNTFRNVDIDVNNCLKRISKATTNPMTIEERLRLLYDIYNFSADFPFDKKIAPISNDGKLDFKKMAQYGMTTKDLIGPDSMDFAPSHFKIGEQFGAAFFIDHLPSTMSTSILDDISNISCNMLLSVTYVPMDQSVAIKMIRNQKTAVEAQAHTIRSQSGGLAALPSELEQAINDTGELISDVLSRDQKIFKVTVLCVIFAETQNELRMHEMNLKSIVNTHLCQLRKLTNQEERGLNTALPFAEMHVGLDRILTTEAASVFIPYTVQELYQEHGVYYGLNAVSKNMIRYDRCNGANYNGLIIGQSGSGKSFITKMEIQQKLLNTDHKVIIIDPEGEYRNLGKKFNATTIKIDSSGKACVNPLDMDMQYAGEGENPIAMKSGYITSLIETMLDNSALSPIEKNVIQRVTRTIYQRYFLHMKDKINNEGITCDKDAMPTLADLYEELMRQKEPSAQALATAIESYCVGAYDTFAHRTNVNTESRLIIYDVKDMPGGMKNLAMQVCANDGWNHMIENGKKGQFTDFYIDEFHLFTKTQSSAAFMKDLFKRARKWKGSPTAITQNIGDLLVNDDAAALVNNCTFVIMMNQSPMDRSVLSEMYQISSALQDYITDKGPGVGLIYNGKTIIPFENSFDDKNATAFKIMDSRNMG